MPQFVHLLNRESGSRNPRGRGGCVSKFGQVSSVPVRGRKGDALEVVDLVEELQVKGGGGECAPTTVKHRRRGPTCMWVQPPCWAFQLPRAVMPRSMHRISRFQKKDDQSARHAFRRVVNQPCSQDTLQKDWTCVNGTVRGCLLRELTVCVR